MIKPKNHLLIASLILLLSTCIAALGIVHFTQKSYIFAESDETLTTENVTYTNTSHGHIEISAVVKTQSPIGKLVPIEVTYTPQISGIKGYLTVSDYSGLTPKDDKTWIPVEKDKTYKKVIHLQPKREGTYDVVVDIIIFGYDVNYGDSTTVTVTLNKNLVVKETATTFLLYQILMYLLIIIVLVFAVFGLRKYGKKLLTAIRNWVFNDPKYRDVANREEIESFYIKLHEKGQPDQAKPKNN